MAEALANVQQAMRQPFLIRVEWDDAARVRTADSDDVPGLATEADTLEALNLKLRKLMPELLALNGIAFRGTP
jgi:hypothetical protein